MHLPGVAQPDVVHDPPGSSVRRPQILPLAWHSSQERCVQCWRKQSNVPALRIPNSFLHGPLHAIPVIEQEPEGRPRSLCDWAFCVMFGLHDPETLHLLGIVAKVNTHPCLFRCTTNSKTIRCDCIARRDPACRDVAINGPYVAVVDGIRARRHDRTSDLHGAERILIQLQLSDSPAVLRWGSIPQPPQCIYVCRPTRPDIASHIIGDVRAEDPLST
mmetsp:Transcript_15190/g.35590  ORF Transcript_15190/g.35590 Transcript_15190/m.35590 type:complete len:217 (+) Transcript_15190:902-1552(+)